MHLLSILLFSLSANLDNLVIGLSYGIRKIPVRLPANLVISTLIFIGTGLALELGERCLSFLPTGFSAFLGSGIIILVGCAGLLRVFIKKSKAPGSIPQNAPPLSLRNAFGLGLALSANNIGVGIGAGFSGLAALPSAAVAFVFSFVLLQLGNRIGRSRLAGKTGRFAEPLANLIMIALGVYELFT